MKGFIKFAAAVGVAGVLALSMAAPSQAAHGRKAAAAAIGFGTGLLVGAAVADAANGPYYGARYRDRYGYGYGRGAYAYVPENGYRSRGGCATEGTYGKGADESFC